MPKKLLNYLLFVLIGLSLVLVVISFMQVYPKAKAPYETAVSPTAIPTASSAAALSQIKTVQGTITQVSKDKISIKTETSEETFTLTQLLEVGKPAKVQATAGATTKASVTDLKVGQQVRIVGTKDTNAARLILIRE